MHLEKIRLNKIQNGRWMHPKKFQVDKIQNGRLSAIIHLDRPDILEYHENRSRYLHHYYKKNCKVSGEDAF